jgi:hypothetical protein
MVSEQMTDGQYRFSYSEWYQSVKLGVLDEVRTILLAGKSHFTTVNLDL